MRCHSIRPGTERSARGTRRSRSDRQPWICPRPRPRRRTSSRGQEPPPRGRLRAPGSDSTPPPTRAAETSMTIRCRSAMVADLTSGGVPVCPRRGRVVVDCAAGDLPVAKASWTLTCHGVHHRAADLRGPSRPDRLGLRPAGCGRGRMGHLGRRRPIRLAHGRAPVPADLGPRGVHRVVGAPPSRHPVLQPARNVPDPLFGPVRARAAGHLVHAHPLTNHPAWGALPGSP